jgi:hypothetical protein
MSAVALRVLIFLVIAAAVFFGVRRIWRDWRKQLKALDQADRQRDLRERERPDVITLKRDKDGKFRPGDE